MLHVLIVEDEKPISNLIRMSLTKEGFHCTCAYDGGEAADLLEKNVYDLVLLDVMLPEIDGFELMEYIRPLEIPVIFLTAKSAVADRVKGLRLGAEDYIVKPFDTIELLARIDVVMRRYQKCDMVIEVGGVRIDTASMRVWREDEEISLTKTEYDLLLLFARNPRRAMCWIILLSHIVPHKSSKLPNRHHLFKLSSCKSLYHLITPLCNGVNYGVESRGSL